MFTPNIEADLYARGDDFERYLMIAYKEGTVLDKNTIEIDFQYRWRKYYPDWYKADKYSHYF